MRRSLLEACIYHTSGRRRLAVIPVPKKRSPSQLNDYRPVALTSVPLKCAERIVLKELRLQTTAHQDPLQFACTQRRSADDAILTMLQTYTRTSTDQAHNYARLFFVDFSSVFSTTQPHLLVVKLLDQAGNPQFTQHTTDPRSTL